MKTSGKPILFPSFQINFSRYVLVQYGRCIADVYSHYFRGAGLLYWFEYKTKREKRQKMEAQQTAQALGLAFSEKDNFGLSPHLTSKLEALAREKFGPEQQKFLLSGPRIHLEGCNYYLIAYQPKKLLQGEEARLFFERCSQLTALLKGAEKQDLLDLTEIKKDVEAQPIVLPEAQKREID